MTTYAPVGPESSEADVCFKTSVDLGEDCLKVTLERLSVRIPEILPEAVFKSR